MRSNIKREAKLSELFDMQMGKTPDRNNLEYWENGTHPWISIADMTSNGNVIEDTKECITDKAIYETGIKPIFPGTVIMSFKLSVGKVTRVLNKSYSNEAIMAFEIKDDLPIGIGLTNEYVYYLLSALDFTNTGNKAVMGKTLNKKILENTEVSIHSWESQKEIVSILDKVDELIDMRKKQLSKLDELVKSRFVEMFGDPVINDRGWLIDKLGNYMTTLTDFSANGSYELLDSNVVMYDEPNYAIMVRTTDLESGNLTSGVKYIDESAYNLLDKSKLFGGELIMNKIGSAGKIYVMPHINYPASLGRNAFMFRFDSRLNITYLYALLTSDYGVNEIQQYVRGAVTKTITKDSTRSIRIIVPPIELQNEFKSFVEQVDKSKFEVKESLEKLETLKKALMQEYFG